MYNLFKNNRLIITGLKRSTYMHVFESMRKRADKFSLCGLNNVTIITVNDDVYKLVSA